MGNIRKFRKQKTRKKRENLDNPRLQPANGQDAETKNVKEKTKQPGATVIRPKQTAELPNSALAAQSSRVRHHIKHRRRLLQMPPWSGCELPVRIPCVGPSGPKPSQDPAYPIAIKQKNTLRQTAGLPPTCCRPSRPCLRK